MLTGRALKEAAAVLLAVGVGFCALTPNVCAAERKCTDQYGTLLYIVAVNGRVSDAHGKILGDVKPNGDVVDAHGKLVARNGDAGLLFRGSKTGQQQ